MQLPVFHDLQPLRDYVQTCRQEGKRITLIPTMGALHEGHLSLVTKGLEDADIAIASIFVNPKQFAPHEDFDSYPRTLDEDIKKLKEIGAHAVWAPKSSVMYPKNDSTNIVMSNISEPLEGEFRPHFFHGVATVVTKLLLQVLPDTAIFGEKDYQQLMVIKRLVQDLCIPVEIIGGKLVRDKNGLALSSRNAYLSEREYDIALNIHKILLTMKTQRAEGTPINVIEKEAMQTLLDAGFDSVDYCALRDSETLLPPTNSTQAMRGLIAATIGKTRLIDNAAM